MSIENILSITTGILSLLVTVLLGFQIYNVIAIDKKLKEVDGKMESFENLVDMKISDSIQKYNNSIQALLLIINVNTHIDKFSNKELFTRYLKAVESGLKGSDEGVLNTSLSVLNLVLTSEYNVFKQKGKCELTLSHEEKVKAVSILSRCPFAVPGQMYEMISHIQSLPEIDD